MSTPRPLYAPPGLSQVGFNNACTNLDGPMAQGPIVARRRLALSDSTVPTDQENLSLETILERLTTVVAALEKGDLALEDSLKAFEEGIGLAREGQRRIDAAEQRVEQLLQGENGGLKLSPIERT